jgi:hypothetical protein
MSNVYNQSRDDEKSLGLLFRPADVVGHDLDRQVLCRLSEPSLLRIWDNDLDAAYDSYQALYDLLNE